MLLAIDIGNTNVVVGIFDGERLVHAWRLETERGKMPDEWWVLLSVLAANSGVDLQALHGAVIGSVVPRLTSAFREMIQRHLGVEPIVVSAALDLGITVAVDNPAEAGADRLANSVAAYTLYPGPSVVVDLGTATSFDVTNERGEYLGGAIAPGITVALEALTARAARLFAVDLVVPERAIGRNTTQSIQSGLMLGYIGLIEGLLSRIARELGAEPTVIATGGLGALVTAHVPMIDVYEPDLTLIGLRLIYERLREQAR